MGKGSDGAGRGLDDEGMPNGASRGPNSVGRRVKWHGEFGWHGEGPDSEGRLNSARRGPDGEGRRAEW